MGNKIDEVKNRRVSTMQGQKFAEFYDMQFYEVSAKDNCSSADIDRLFYSVTEKISANAASQTMVKKRACYKNSSRFVADDMLLMADQSSRNNFSCCSA